MPYVNSSAGTNVARIINKLPKAFSNANDLHPRDVLPQPHGPTQVEEMPIVKVSPTMCVYRPVWDHIGHGGVTVNIGQNIAGLSTILARLTADLPFLVVRR